MSVIINSDGDTKVINAKGEIKWFSKVLLSSDVMKEWKVFEVPDIKKEEPLMVEYSNVAEIAPAKTGKNVKK